MLREEEEDFDELQHLHPSRALNKGIEEETQHLQPVEAFVQEQSDSSLTERTVQVIRNFAKESPHHCGAILLLLLMSIVVMGIMIKRDMKHEWQECDENTQMAKHFYCFNFSAPAVHRRLSLHLISPRTWRSAQA